MTNWRKYEFVCDPHTCDSLLELTVKDGDFKFPNGVAEITCPCGRQMQCISANLIVQERKETTPMETTETPVQEAPLHYNPNQLVTYKVIDIDDTYSNTAVAHYPTTKVTELEWELEQGRRQVKKTNALQSKINRIIDNLTADSWYHSNIEKAEVLSDLCEILEFNPVKTIDFTANVTINGTVEIPMDEAEDFELDEYVYDNLSIDTHTGSMYINSFDVDRVDEN